ncbi:MAG: ABC transporter permease [Candidatus Magnetomorum sp.]|nr:ABC transporter permease [Candidatus Magnetomorum sp.]
MWRKTGYGCIGIVLLIAGWSMTGYMIFTQPGYEQFSGFLPIPTFKALYQLLFDISFWQSVWASLRRIILGISLAAVLGIPMGILVGFYTTMRMISYPPIQFLRMISPISWMPIALLVFQSFESAIVFLLVMATIWPIIINTTLGVTRVNPRWILMAINQGAKNYQLIFKIIIPSTLPYMLASLRMALGVAWIVLVPAEFLGISSGLGYIINDARDTMSYDRLMAIVIAIGIIGTILDALIESIQRPFQWRKTHG